VDYVIVDAVLGLLCGAACLSIPQLVRVHRQRPDHADTDEYLKQTGRSVWDIAQENAAVLSQQNGDAQAARTAVHGVTR
jgi:hypothetical protein